MKMQYLKNVKRGLLFAGVVAGLGAGSAFAQNQAIGFTPGNPFSNAYVAGNTLYIAGQQGPDEHGKVTGTDITFQTTSTIAVIKKLVEAPVSK